MSAATGARARTERRPMPPASIRLRLSPRIRKVVLLTHIAAAGAWLGLDLVLGVLVFTAFTASAVQSAAAAASVASFATWPLITVGLVTLVTGVLLGVGSKYGLVRYWWVLAKLVLNVVLVTLVVLVLAPGTSALSGAALDSLAAGTAPTLPSTLVFPPIVSSTAVIVAMALAVFKPWGRVGARRRRA
ncbi:hypothetical protein [Agromyces ramosus]|uniref:Phage shock protein PspC (Stress-responsive transcriptional regulator) n=1 Tax=Agromyces ramosus TaxID=33879 RepID=A0ABU0R9Z5_9MICO|nr:hypothetical protein [Agromyces ramosus]MDQ0894900.1 phage shock protein PspC (stress-responsive transcriptional regulator) [Agromyces ramosus]